MGADDGAAARPDESRELINLYFIVRGMFGFVLNELLDYRDCRLVCLYVCV